MVRMLYRFIFSMVEHSSSHSLTNGIDGYTVTIKDGKSIILSIMRKNVLKN
jgi:hypothetical protein